MGIGKRERERETLSGKRKVFVPLLVGKQTLLTLSMRPSEDLLAVGIKPHTPEPHSGHQLVGPFHFAVAAEHGVDELLSALLTHGDTGRTLADVGVFDSVGVVGAGPHVIFATLEELLHALPKAVPRVEELGDQGLLLGALDATGFDALLGSLALPAQLDEKQPEFTGHFGGRGLGAVSVYGPIVDPLAEGVRVEYGSEEHDGSFLRVPVIGGVTLRDAGGGGLFLGRRGRSADFVDGSWALHVPGGTRSTGPGVAGARLVAGRSVVGLS
jgi:hypothetical protein